MNIHSVYALAGTRFRKRRLKEFLKTFGVTANTRVLDVGGTRRFWELSPVKPKVVVLNIQGAAEVIGNASRLPFRDNEFDICFSNSVIEHVSLSLRTDMANEIRRVARAYYVQTPNYWFPVEPHFLALGLHWIPRKYRVSFRWLGFHWWIARPTKSEMKRLVNEITLLKRHDLISLFPNAEIRLERVLGLPKSLLCIRTAQSMHASLASTHLQLGGNSNSKVTRDRERSE